MRTETYDVTIVGAGPAGSTLAYQLAESGISTCIIDKDTFPRKKVCAGGLPAKVLDIAPFDIGPTIQNEVSSVVLTHKMEGEFNKSYGMPLLHTVVRESFDDFLLKKAVTSDATFKGGEWVEKISLAGNSHSIMTTNGEVRARILVGADGANSIVARSAGLSPIDYRHLAIQITVPLELIRKLPLPNQTIALDWGYLRNGYAWLFPNGESASLGAMSPTGTAQALRAYLNQWTRHFGLTPEDFPLCAHTIPHRVTSKPISTGKVLLIGDAAGLADYWTGEGIYNAIKSAQIAAQQIYRFLAGDPDALGKYKAVIDRAILPELKAAYAFSRIFNYSHAFVFYMIREYTYPWDVFCRVMRGDRSFVQIRERLSPHILIQKMFLKGKRGR